MASSAYISEGGMALTNSAALQVGERAALRLTLAGTEVTATFKRGGLLK